VLCRLAELFVDRGVPDYIRSDNGPEFTAKVVRKWLRRVKVKTLYSLLRMRVLPKKVPSKGSYGRRRRNVQVLLDL
jgi:hypothetical protein